MAEPIDINGGLAKHLAAKSPTAYIFYEEIDQLEYEKTTFHIQSSTEIVNEIPPYAWMRAVVTIRVILPESATDKIARLNSIGMDLHEHLKSVPVTLDPNSRVWTHRNASEIVNGDMMYSYVQSFRVRTEAGVPYPVMQFLDENIDILPTR